jgi:transcriptional regulator GlxA family with amidase domain
LRQIGFFQLWLTSAAFRTAAPERRQVQPNYYQEIVEKTKCLTESNVYGAINVPNIAEQTGVSTSRLNEIFKTYTVMTPYQYYIHIKAARTIFPSGI